MNKKVLIYGLGDTHKKDDGIGVHVINYLKKNNKLKNAIIVDDASVQSATNEDFLGVDRLIVVEAAYLNSDPGFVKVFEGIELDAILNRQKMKFVHTKGLDRVLKLTQLNGRLPNHRALVGIQPEILSAGDEPSEKVASAIPRACQKVFQISSNWLI